MKKSKIYFLDIETVPRKGVPLQDLKVNGLYRYAEAYDPLVIAIADESKAVKVWANTDYAPPTSQQAEAAVLIAAALESGATIVAHNAEFERVNLRAWCNRNPGKFLVSPERWDANSWECTLHMCRRAGLPGSLDKAGELMGIPVKKDKRGTALMKLFSIPSKAGKVTSPHSDPSGFLAYCEYCRDDVAAEIGLYELLCPHFGNATHKNFLPGLTAAINDRGVSVDVPTTRRFVRDIVDPVQEGEGKRFQSLVGFESTKLSRFKAWLQARGVAVGSLAKGEIETVIRQAEAKGDAAALEALDIHQRINFAALKKYPAILNNQIRGRVHGSHTYYGAGTGRWTSTALQTQNMKRSTKLSQLIYEAVRDKLPADIIEEIHGGDLVTLSEAVRHVLRPESGAWFQADFAAVEARIVAWMAGCKALLDEFEGEGKVYEVMAALIYGCDKSEIGKKSEQRQLGKFCILGFGYSMGWPKFIEQCAGYGTIVSEELAQKAMESYRGGFPEIPRLWKKLMADSTRCVKTGAKVGRWEILRIGRHRWLTFLLPSGRKLAYFKPEIIKDQFGGDCWQYSRPKGGSMIHCRMWQGIITENISQAIGADLMYFSACELEAAGYRVALLVHDEAVIYPKEGGSVAEVEEIMSRRPPWAKTFPLAAEGDVMNYYRK